MTPRELEEYVIGTWNFADPEASAAAFRAAAADQEDGSAPQIVLLSQVARAVCLSGDPDAAASIVDGCELAAAELADGAARDHALARVSIERGRILNSSGQPTDAEPFFESAYDHASRAGTAGLAVDALHMRAIVAGQIDSPGASLALNERALGIAETSPDPAARRWVGSLLNNLGWDLHAAGSYDDALAVFERALGVQTEAGEPEQVTIARWCVARTLRSLGRVEDALAIQRQLDGDPANAGDGHIPQEIAACLTELGRADEAAPYQARADALLGGEAGRG